MAEHGVSAGIDRRLFLGVTAAAAAGTSAVLEPLVFTAPAAAAQQPPPADETRTITGRFEPGAPDWVYLPVEVPPGVREIAVSYSYDKPAPPAGAQGNALDIGVFDQRGIALGGRGFRGWSGGFRTSFSISRTEATPGYLPGPVGAGRWHVILGPYTVAPQGMQYTVEVTLRYGEPGPAFQPDPAPDKATGRGRAWYRGDMHLHTVHSDGARLPEELVAAARAAKLDFIASSEHNTSSASGIWGRHAGPDLLIVDGEEITTRNGHFLAVGLPAGAWIDWRYRATDGSFAEFARRIHRLGGLVVAAHPYCPFVGCAWKFGYERLDAVEVWNGPWTPDDDAAVATWDNLLVADARTGDWLPAVGDSDAHREPQVVGLPQTVVLADDLDRRSILAGVKAGRSWLAESAAVDLTFTASGAGRTAGIGERLTVAEGAAVTVSLTVSGAPSGLVRFVTDEGQLFAQFLSPDGAGTVTWTTTPRQSAYVRAEVRHLEAAFPQGRMLAMTNPIFLGRVRP